MALAAIFAAVAIVAESRAALNADVAWYIHLAGRVLDGERLYTDVIEINPPLIVWLTIPAAWIHRATGLPPSLVWALVMGLVGALSAAATIRQLRHLGWSRSARAAAGCALAFVLFPLMIGVFGQREHLIVALLLPWLALSARRLAGQTVETGTALLLGVLGAIAFALKPHFALIAVLVVVWRSWSVDRRRLRLHPEDVALVAVAVCYLGAVAVLTPGFFDVVRALGDDYFSYKHRELRELAFKGIGASVAWGSLAAGVIAVRRRPDPELVVLVAGVAGSFGAVIAQQKGWGYHFVPVWVLGFLLAMLVIGRMMRPLDVRTVPAGAFSILILALLAGVTVSRTVKQLRGASLTLRDRVSYDSRRKIEAYADSHPDIRSALFFTGDPSDPWPIVLDRFPESRPGLMYIWLRTREVGQPRTAPQQFIFDRAVADLTERGADLVVISAPGPDTTLFDFRAYLLQDSAFAHALRSYDSVARVNDLVLYRRRPTTRPIEGE